MPVPSSRSHRRRLLVAAVLAALLLLVTACSEETQDQISDAIGDAGSGGDVGGETPPDAETPPEPEPTTPPEPEPTAPPEPEPTAPPEPEPAPPDGEELSDEDWLVLVVIGVLALALIIGTTALVSQRSAAKQSAQATLDHRVRQLTGAGQWLHDQGSIEVLRMSDPDQIRTVWGTTRAQFLELEARTRAVGATVTDPALAGHLQRLETSVASLRGAIDSSVSLRLDPEASAKATLVESATQTVLDRRRELDAALRPLAGVGRETL